LFSCVARRWNIFIKTGGINGNQVFEFKKKLENTYPSDLSRSSNNLSKIT
jgi:hypothetical protein